MVSVIIPAYNEEKRIEKTVLAIDSFLTTMPESYEILVVDDGSSDQTKKVVKTMETDQVKLLSYEINRGKGGAVKFGVNHAAGDFIVFTDADLPYPPEKIAESVDMLQKGAEVVLGKRVHVANGGRYPWYRTLMSYVFGLWVRLILGTKERDTQCGFKAFRKQAAKDIFEKVTLSGWGFDVEVIYLAETMHYQIKRIPVELFHEREDSKINVKQATMNMIREVLLVKKNKKSGIYG